MDTPPQSRSGRRQLLDRFMNSRQVGSAAGSQAGPDSVSTRDAAQSRSSVTERTGPTERPDTESRDIISAPGRSPASDGVNVPDGVRSARRVEPLVVVGSRIRYASASLFRTSANGTRPRLMLSGGCEGRRRLMRF